MGWRWARRLGLVAGGLLTLGSGCVPSVYQCAQDTQCGSEGFCEASGFCSFSDETCPSGRRYGAFSGGELADSCVLSDPASSTGDQGETTAVPDLESTGGSSTSTGDATTSGIIPMTRGSSSSSDSGAETSTGADESSSSSTGPMVVQRVEDGLVVFYRLDEGDGPTVHDSAPLAPPIDLTLTGTGFEWVADGLRFTGDDGTIAASTTSTTKLNNACMGSGSITLESWVTPVSVSTPGPPRLVTYSEDSASRNFSLMIGSNVTGEEPPAFRGRLRTDALFLNGTPSTVAELEGAAKQQLAHVVYMRDADGDERIFVDGTLAGDAARAGDFSVWDTTGVMRLALGNEFAHPRPLDGTLHLVAVYCRALDPDEVQQNYDAGF